MKTQEKKIYEFDAKDMTMGRLSASLVRILTGKDSADYSNNWPLTREVRIKNIDKLRFTGKKYSQKVYYHHTGYLGHLKVEKLKVLFEKNPQLVFKKALRGMLPKNKWRDKLLKRVKFV